ncbi:MAG: serine/threonine-protein phosphatase [Desulfuromonas sp.]|uniref:PP2C family protein-serine/threonine phosphatase n=1 Tax=Desulfuromonas sp. TaxID=892 RepID=UPI000CC5EBC0|nr:PP2C family protein-serine/threonine phosphatase [Desulfuromonas sp.]PLX85498.1 MAG: serine/threonine-protein phosphatase [Desulfuromonas sp.]
MNGFNTQDVGLAREVQQLLFPKGSPLCTWCCMGVKNRMAQGLGGDYFEFITLPDGCQVVFIGDVTGHGLHASLVMALLYGFIHEATSRKCDPLHTVTEVNRFLQTFAKRSDKYDHYFTTTLFCSIIDPRTLSMHYVNAGHVAPMVRRGKSITYLAPTAQPLGFFDEPELGVKSFNFEKGDRLILYTDGITETFDDQGHIFGHGRLEKVLLAHEGDHEKFLEDLFEEIQTFSAIDPPEDDCTAIVIDLHGPFTNA